MVEKNCLLIDDEIGPQKRIFASSVALPLKRDGIHVNLIPIDTTEKELQSEERIDIKKLKEYIEERIKTLKIDVVACDYELASDSINGIEVVKIIRELRKKVPIFLYSGKYQKIITDILTKFDKEDPESLGICTHHIRQIYNSNIKDFLERNDYPSTLVGFFRNQEVTKEDVLVEKLREYPELPFRSCFPRFDGKILSEIADEVEKETKKGQDFIEELTEQTVAYMIKINQDE